MLLTKKVKINDNSKYRNKYLKLNYTIKENKISVDTYMGR